MSQRIVELCEENTFGLVTRTLYVEGELNKYLRCDVASMSLQVLSENRDADRARASLLSPPPPDDVEHRLPSELDSCVDVVETDHHYSSMM